MSQQKKLETILDLLINEESEKAEELLHELVVEKARSIYEEIINEEEEPELEEEESCDEEEEDMVEEDFGGDEEEDFTGDIEAAKDDIESDEEMDGEMEFDGEEEEMSTEDKVDDLEDQLAQLRAEFDALMDQEAEEPYHDMEEIEGAGDEFGGDEEMEMEAYMEATKFSDNVSAPSNSEGQLAGNGGSLSGTDTKSMYSKAPSKSLNGASPVKINVGDEKGGKPESAKNETPSDNIDVDSKNVNHGEQTAEGKPVGTGKNTKTGAVNTKSPLSSAPKKP